MKVHEIMNREIIHIPIGTRYSEVIGVLRTHQISGAPVTNEKGELVGIVSEKDLLRVLYPYYESYYLNPEQYTDHEDREKKASDIQNRPVEQFMSLSVHTAAPDMPIMRAGSIMISHGIHRLPVVEKGKLVGIVTRRDIYKKLIELNFGNILNTP
jgi:CBS domain-containing protein